jgi:hypothetical protein
MKIHGQNSFFTDQAASHLSPAGRGRPKVGRGGERSRIEALPLSRRHSIERTRDAFASRYAPTSPHRGEVSSPRRMGDRKLP